MLDNEELLGFFKRRQKITILKEKIKLAWIDMVDEENAEGKLSKVYNDLTGSGKSKVANVLKVQSLNPELLEDHLNLYKTVMYAKSNISRKQREMIATIVSDTNDCYY